MESHLNLIKTNYQEVEKRIFPRFPFSFLTFKENSEGKEDSPVFQVVNISRTGMQLSLKDGGHTYRVGEKLSGELHWRKARLNLEADVKWVKGARLGLEFRQNEGFEEQLTDFLSIENIVAGMRPVHESGLDLDIPNNLKYWLRADGPFEVFVWRHRDNELSRFQVILMDHFVEWQDGRGLKTGEVLNQRDLDSPLHPEDEFLFQFDESVDQNKVDFAQSVVNHLPQDYLPVDVMDFLQLKLDFTHG